MKHTAKRRPRRTPKLLVFALRCELYPFTAAFVIGPRPPDPITGRICRRFKLWDGKGQTPTFGDGKAAVCHFGSGSVVWFSNANHSPDFHSSLVHEIFHVVMNLSEKIRERPNFCHDELHAYYAGWLAEKFWTRVLGRRRVINR